MSEGYLIDFEKLDKDFPTEGYPEEFWCSLGRCIASFGMLEQTLRMAILLLTATTPYSEEEVGRAFKKWIPRIEANQSSTLMPLIEQYAKEVRRHPEIKVENLEELLEDLVSLAAYRNPLAHAAWPRPDGKTSVVPHFQNKKGEVFDTDIDQEFLERVHRATGRMIASIMNTILHMGYKFPGLPNSPGRDAFAGLTPSETK